MATTLSLLQRASSLATSGLSALRQDDDLVSYDDLVTSKGILDLILELPSFEAELGKYLASINLCGSILARSIRQRRSTLLTLDKSARRRPSQPAGKGVVELEKSPTASSPTSSIGTLPSAWEADDTLTFNSILGNSAAKRALFEHVVLPLKLSEEARATIFAGIRSSGNVLLHGPPGTGKTSLAQAASQEAGASFYSVIPSSILSKYQGESERVLHQLFADAKKTKPSIIFLDELDALAPSRDAQDDVQSRRLLAELLLQTSQLRPNDQVVLVAATNRLDDIDVALLRRFHSRIFVGPPSHKERVDMMASFMEGIEHALDNNHLSSLADRMLGWSGSDIQSLCREACMGPIRSLYEQEGDLERALQQPPEGEAVTLRPVQMSDCETAYSALMGNSAGVNTDHDQVSATEELVVEDLERQTGKLGVAEGEEGEGQVVDDMGRQRIGVGR